MDGENTTLYHDGFHARSVDSVMHESRTWLAQFHAQIKTDIPRSYRICGEYLYARHSIAYNNLKSYFLGFSIWDGELCLSWEETIEWFNLIGIVAVPVLWEGVLKNIDILHDIGASLNTQTQEGFVMRLAGSFKYDEFAQSVCKYVRAGHVQTDTHWMHSKIIKNDLFRK